MIQPATRYECSKRVVTVLPPGQNAPVEIRAVPAVHPWYAWGEPAGEGLAV